MYSFSEETLTKLRKFRFSSARSDTVQAQIYSIDKTTYEIKPDDETVTSIEDLVEELPDNSPRYIVLSYPLEKDGRKTSPLVLIYWLPPTSQQSLRMLYAAAVELIREKAGVSKYVYDFHYVLFSELILTNLPSRLIELQEEEDFDDIEEKVL